MWIGREEHMSIEVQERYRLGDRSVITENHPLYHEIQSVLLDGVPVLALALDTGEGWADCLIDADGTIRDPNKPLGRRAGSLGESPHRHFYGSIRIHWSPEGAAMAAALEETTC